MKRAFALFLLLTTFAQAREEFVPGSRFISARGAALGDSIEPSVDDGSALFYNPAGLSRIQKPSLEVMNLELRSNTQYVANLTRDFYNFPRLGTYGKTLVRKKGMEPAGGYSLFPNFSMRGFAIGVLAQADLRATSDGSGISYRSKYEFIPAVGFSRRFASGVVKLGYSLLWVNQASGKVTVDSADPNLGYNQYLKQGSGFSHNMGLAITMPVQYLPSLNVVARNVGGLKYTGRAIGTFGSNTTGLPDNEAMTFDIAVGAQPKIGNGALWNLSAVLRDATSTSHASLYGRLALGAEFSFRNAFFLRGGFQSGYLSAGLGLRTARGELNLSWYGEEYGNGFRNKQDIKYMFQYKIRAF